MWEEKPFWLRPADNMGKEQLLNASGRRNDTWRMRRRRVAVLVLSFLAHSCTAQQTQTENSLLLKTSPAECKAVSGNIFKVPALTCFKCPLGQEPSPDGLSCVCTAHGREQYEIATTGDGPVLTCFDCSKLLLTVTLDRKTCIPCGNVSALEAATPQAQVANNNGTTTSTSTQTSAASNNTVTCLGAGGALLSSSTCVCPVGYVLSDFNTSGAISTRLGKYCAPCPFNSYVDPTNPFVCTPCPDLLMRRSPTTGVCECIGGTIEDSVLIAGVTTADIPYVGRHVCISKSVSDGLNSLVSEYAAQTFYNARDIDNSRKDVTKVDRSRPFMTHFLAAATRCKDTRHWQSCQSLANLCVLALYSADTPACKVLTDLMKPLVTKDVNGFNGWTEGFPWLFYGSSTREVLEATNLNREVALTGSNAKLNMTLTAYRLDGSYAGMQSVTTQLLLCKGDDRELSRFMQFGSNSRITCRIDLMQLIRDYSEPLFYELWMDDNLNKDGTPRSTSPALYPIPVIINNYRQGSETPNSILSSSPDLDLRADPVSLAKVVMHRRFFLWDNMSGRRVLDSASRAKAEASGTAGQPGADMVVVRWARYIELRVKLRENDPATSVDEGVRMYPPYLHIEYDQQIVSTIPQGDIPLGDSREGLRYPEVLFRAAYTMELGYYWYVSMILLIVLIVIMVIAYGIKVSVRNQAGSLPSYDGLLADLLGTVADALFWGLFFMCGYWFFFYKLQSQIKVLLPLENPHPVYLTVVIVCIVCKILQVMLLVYRQCQIDIFFIDWEKERVSDDKPAGGSNEKDKAVLNSQVSVWRSILIANEWCEMQGRRHTDIDFTLMFLLLFLAGLDFQYLATPQPNSSDLTPSALNYVLRYFTIAMWYFAVVLAQLVWKAFSYRFDRDPLDLFVDLCQLANISTIIIDDVLHGYYIHGRVVHPHSDVNMFTMQANLKAESDGNLPYRGLTQRKREELNGASDSVFEIYVTDKIKKDYVALFSKLKGSQNTAGRGEKDVRNVEVVSRAYHQINAFLKKDIVDEIVTSYSSEVAPPSLVHKIIGMPPPKTTTQPVFLRDNQQLFSRTLFYGIEYDLLIFDFLIFIMWDLIFMNVFIDALLTYVVAHALIELRCMVGNKNVAQKTLVDERFLV